MFNLRSLDLNLLTVFEAIYESGSVSGAAERLCLSQSATSHALSRLREMCADALFVRNGRRLAPTSTATEMFAPIKHALETLRESLAQASGFDPLRSQRHFRISIPHPMGPFYALTLRDAAAQLAPAVTFSFDTVSRPVALEDALRDGMVDLAIDWLPALLDPFVNKKLFDERLALVVRRGHPRIGAHPTLEALLDEEFVLLHRRRAPDQLPQGLEQLDRLGLRVIVHVNELLEIPALVACTDLLGVFPTSMAAFTEKRLGLAMVPAPIELPAVPIHMVWHEARRGDAGHQWLRELIPTVLNRTGMDIQPAAPWVELLPQH